MLLESGFIYIIVHNYEIFNLIILIFCVNTLEVVFSPKETTPKVLTQTGLKHDLTFRIYFDKIKMVTVPEN